MNYESENWEKKRRGPMILVSVLLLTICALVVVTMVDSHAATTAKSRSVNLFKKEGTSTTVTRDVTSAEDAMAISMIAAFNVAKVGVIPHGLRFVCGLDHLIGNVNSFLQKTYNPQCVLNKFPAYPLIDPIDLNNAVFVTYTDETLLGDFFHVSSVQRALTEKGTKLLILDGKKIGSWAIMLVLEPSTKRLWVIFRGTKTFRGGWAHNIVTVLVNTNVLTLDAMRAEILNWRATYGKMGYQIYGFAGHSNGGMYLQRVLMNWKVWRISFDGGFPLPPKYEGKYADTYVNLRALNDPVSAMGIPQNQCCVAGCLAGHGDMAPCFKPKIDQEKIAVGDYRRRWCAVYPGFCNLAVDATLVPITPDHGVNQYLDLKQYCP